MTDIPDDKQILIAANKLIKQFKNVQDAKMHTAMKSDAFLDEGDIDGHLTWLKIHRAIIELTDVEWDGETVH